MFVVVTVSISMASTVAHFVSVEASRIHSALTASLAILRPVAAVAMLRVKAVVHMAMEVRGPMEPRANADKGAAVKPLRTVVPVRSTTVRGVVVVSVRACWGDSNAETDLSLCLGGACCHDDHCHCSECKQSELIHEMTI